MLLSPKNQQKPTRAKKPANTLQNSMSYTFINNKPIYTLEDLIIRNKHLDKEISKIKTQLHYSSTRDKILNNEIDFIV